MKFLKNKYLWIYKLCFEFTMNSWNCNIRLFLIIDNFFKNKLLKFNSEIEIKEGRVKRDRWLRRSHIQVKRWSLRCLREIFGLVDGIVCEVHILREKRENIVNI